jgi:hypothetical protein
MAKIHEELIVVKLSKLHKDSESVDALVGEEMSGNLEAIVQQLVGDDVIVEIIKE